MSGDRIVALLLAGPGMVAAFTAGAVIGVRMTLRRIREVSS